MRLKAVVLGLLVFGIVFAPSPGSWSSPYMNPLPTYSNYLYFVSWQWDNSSMNDNYYGHTPPDCGQYPCFYYYEVNESGKSNAIYYSNLSWINYTSLPYRYDEGTYFYKVRVRQYLPGGDMGDGGVSEYTDWSNTTNTTIDRYPPMLVVSSNQSSYKHKEMVFISANASDSGSGVANLSLYIMGELKNSSIGQNITWSSDNLAPGTYEYFANVSDNSGRVSRDPYSGTKSFTVGAPVTTVLPPNISINAVKNYNSNNETVYLTVVANDSGGLSMIGVMINGTIIDTCRRQWSSDFPVYYSYNCTSGPYMIIQNGSYGFYNYTATVTGTSGLSRTTDASKRFKVFGNSTCADFGYPVNNNQCASNGTQSFICTCYSMGCVLSKKCVDVCYCPSGFSCNSTNQACSLPSGTSACSDGTPYGRCSITLPKYCANGALIDNCTECGCSAGYNCSTASNSCYANTYNPLCGNGLCEAGENADCCRDCGCGDGKMCNRTTDLCYIPPGPAVYIGLSLVSPKQTNVFLSPGQTVRFVLELKDENKRLVNNATIIVYPATEKYSSGFMGDGQYEVTYQARTDASAYFQSYTINMKAKRVLGSEEQFSQPISLSITLDRFLDAEFITPQQNQSVTESQPVEVKIKYPDGSPVLVGSFDMVFGEKTIPLVLSGDTYRAFLNLTNESYGAKNATFIGRDNYNNTLNNILVVYYTLKIDYTVYFVALLLIAGGSAAAYFLYTWGSGLSKDYKTLKKEKVYLETMDKRTHLEFFKRHIDESTFKKLVLEYQQKTTDVDKIVAEMEKRHRWLRWL